MEMWMFLSHRALDLAETLFPPMVLYFDLEHVQLKYLGRLLRGRNRRCWLAQNEHELH
jgi:hypothetical protein